MLRSRVTPARLSMDYQQLLEIAEREIRLNLADDDLLRRAVLQSGGLAAEARQNYWRLRANQLREQIAAAGTDAPVLEIASRLDAQDRRLRSRKERARWIWALACIAALIGCVVCPWLALSAYHHG
ncbi:MAG TPA: hypothetical protein VHE61_20990, partial [Opitutaceae bacterium]|nr:hypothetical protein [Opitutaceae bacterium]